MTEGETKRYQCNSCNKEYEICLEPKMKKETDESKLGMCDDPAYCPFCNQMDIDEV